MKTILSSLLLGMFLLPINIMAQAEGEAAVGLDVAVEGALEELGSLDFDNPSDMEYEDLMLHSMPFSDLQIVIFNGVFGGLYGIILILMLVAGWKVFTKAGKAGWKILIPFYNIIVMLQIIKKPWWWLILLFVPIVNWVISILMSHRLSLSFGRGTGTTIGLILLPFIFLPIIAFGQSKYAQLAE